MSDTNKKSTRALNDDKYKSAARDVVDEALSAPKLAPAIKTAIIENKPLNDALQDVMVETVRRNPDMREALVTTVADGKAIKNSKVDYRQPGFWIPIAISSVLTIISIITSILALIKSGS